MVRRPLLTAGQNDWMTEVWDAGRGRNFRAHHHVPPDYRGHYCFGGKEAGSWIIFAINCHHAQNKTCKWTSIPLHVLVNVKKWRLGSSVNSSLSANHLISSLDKRSRILLRFKRLWATKVCMVLTLDQQGCGIWIWSRGTFPLIGNPLKLSVGGAEPLDSSPMCSEPQEWSPALRGGKGRNGDKRSRWVRRPFTPTPSPLRAQHTQTGRTADRYWKHEPRRRRLGLMPQGVLRLTNKPGIIIAYTGRLVLRFDWYTTVLPGANTWHFSDISVHLSFPLHYIRRTCKLKTFLIECDNSAARDGTLGLLILVCRLCPFCSYATKVTGGE